MVVSSERRDALVGSLWSSSIDIETNIITTAKVCLYVISDISIFECINTEWKLIVIVTTASKIPLECPSIICAVCPINICRISRPTSDVDFIEWCSRLPRRRWECFRNWAGRISKLIFSKLVICGVAPTVQILIYCGRTSVLCTCRNGHYTTGWRWHGYSGCCSISNGRIYAKLPNTIVSPTIYRSINAENASMTITNSYCCSNEGLRNSLGRYSVPTETGCIIWCGSRVTLIDAGRIIQAQLSMVIHTPAKHCWVIACILRAATSSAGKLYTKPHCVCFTIGRCVVTIVLVIANSVIIFIWWSWSDIETIWSASVFINSKPSVAITIYAHSIASKTVLLKYPKVAICTKLGPDP